MLSCKHKYLPSYQRGLEEAKEQLTPSVLQWNSSETRSRANCYSVFAEGGAALRSIETFNQLGPNGSHVDHVMLQK